MRIPPRGLTVGLRAIVAMGLAFLPVPRMAGAVEEPTGEQLYQQRCASCHGANGEGNEDEYPRPLAGERSLENLAKYIAKSMPADDPGTCSPEEAARIASYIYEAFYSLEAQARNQPPRIELSRLTVRQYRNALADLVGTFRDPGTWDDRRGLQGEYFNARGFRKNRRVIERIDPQVHFDFGTAGPEPEKFEPNQFSIRWEGAVIAPESGDYEFIVRTDHAARLWVNNREQPLIDAWVKSGDDTEYRASIPLLGGRAYPLRLEFSKAKQGVDDSDKQKGKPSEVPASITLAWKVPGQAETVIPERNLSPNRSPELFVSEAPFPPDDRSIGYERGTTVSRAWDEATTEAAIELSGYVVEHLRELSGVADDADDREPRLRDFCQRFAERAFRRPLSEESQKLYIDRQFESADDPKLAVKRVVMLVLKSPRFLYLDLDGTLDPFDVASRLSFGLWDSLPDQALLEAAKAGELASREQVAAQAERMLPDLRTHAKLAAFLHQWLKIDQSPDLAKSPERFPDFDKALVSDLRTSLDLFLEDVVWSEGSDFRRLLLAEDLYLNDHLAKFYGAEPPGDESFRKVTLEDGERAGIVTHPYLMARFAYNETSSPIHRGVFLVRGVLGRTLRPPPEAFTPLPADLHPDLSTRERVALQTKPESCATCHSLINPLGFALEHFDAVGRYRQEENDQPIDATGSYEQRDGNTVTFDGAGELADFLAGSVEVQEAFVERLFHQLVKQPILAYGPQELQNLRESFAENDYHVRKLVVEILAATALTPREGVPPVGATASLGAVPKD